MAASLPQSDVTVIAGQAWPVKGPRGRAAGAEIGRSDRDEADRRRRVEPNAAGRPVQRAERRHALPL